MGLVIGIIVTILFICGVGYACCVAAGRADDRAEASWQRWLAAHNTPKEKE